MTFRVAYTGFRFRFACRLYSESSRPRWKHIIKEKETAWKETIEEKERTYEEMKKRIEDKEHLIQILLEEKKNNSNNHLKDFATLREQLDHRMLRLQNNFNLRGALEFSLEEYVKLKGLKTTSKTKILQELITKDPIYDKCLTEVLHRYQLRKKDVNSCSRVLYHELSKHAHGNESELIVTDKDHAITEVAAMESVFCALKKQDCFHLGLKIVIDNEERTLE